VAAARVKRLAAQKKSTDHVIANVIQPNQQVANSLAQGGAIQHIGGTIITSGTSIVGKSPIQGNSLFCFDMLFFAGDIKIHLVAA